MIMLLLCKEKKLNKPLIYLSDFFERNKKEYLIRLQQVREEGMLKEWIEFFLRGLKEQAEKSLIKIEKLEKYKQGIENRIKKKRSMITLNAIDYLFQNPYLRITDLQEFLGVGYNSAKMAVENLHREGVLVRSDDRKREKTYLAKELLEILKED